MEQLDRIDNKIDKVLEKLSEHGELLARHTALHEQNTRDLSHHIARTDALETKLEHDMDTALLPIKSVKWLAKVVAGIAALITALKLIGKI